jgi:hypothetical protein
VILGKSLTGDDNRARNGDTSQLILRRMTTIMIKSWLMRSFQILAYHMLLGLRRPVLARIKTYKDLR